MVDKKSEEVLQEFARSKGWKHCFFVQQFAKKFNFNAEYVRQCLRGKPHSKTGRISQLGRKWGDWKALAPDDCNNPFGQWLLYQEAEPEDAEEPESEIPDEQQWLEFEWEAWGQDLAKKLEYVSKAKPNRSLVQSINKLRRVWRSEARKYIEVLEASPPIQQYLYTRRWTDLLKSKTFESPERKAYAGKRVKPQSPDIVSADEFFEKLFWAYLFAAISNREIKLELTLKNTGKPSARSITPVLRLIAPEDEPLIAERYNYGDRHLTALSIWAIEIAREKPFLTGTKISGITGDTGKDFCIHCLKPIKGKELISPYCNNRCENRHRKWISDQCKRSPQEQAGIIAARIRYLEGVS